MTTLQELLKRDLTDLSPLELVIVASVLRDFRPSDNIIYAAIEELDRLRENPKPDD